MSDNKRQINIFLTEKLLEKCWHVRNYASIYYSEHCQKCGSTEKDNQDLFTPDGFFLLWEKAQKEDWWENFCYEMVPGSGMIASLYLQINHLTFPTLLAEYLGWKEEDNHE